MIGNLYSKYGIGYPSGVGVADTNETWYLETGGGKSWAAMRIPDTCYFIAANSYRIQQIDFEDRLNFITSKGLRDFCINNDLLKKDENFNFAKIFGGGVKEKDGNNYYNTVVYGKRQIC